MKYEVIKISGIVTGVGISEKMTGGIYTENICQTLYDTGNDEKDAAESEKWETKICDALNKAESPDAGEGKERFKRPTDQQVVGMAILVNDGKIEQEKLADMVALADMIIDRLYENGDITIPSLKES